MRLNAQICANQTQYAKAAKAYARAAKAAKDLYNAAYDAAKVDDVGVAYAKDHAYGKLNAYASAKAAKASKAAFNAAHAAAKAKADAKSALST